MSTRQLTLGNFVAHCLEEIESVQKGDTVIDILNAGTIVAVLSPAPPEELNSAASDSKMRNFSRSRNGHSWLHEGQLTGACKPSSAPSPTAPSPRGGPYAIFQRWRDGKNHCERIPKEELPAISRAVDGYQHFTRLADEYAALTEILTQRSGPLLPSKKNPAISRRRKVHRSR